MKSLNKYINIKIRHYSRISGTEPGNFCLFLCSKDQPIDRYSGNVESENNIIMSLVEKFYVLMNIQAKFYKRPGKQSPLQRIQSIFLQKKVDALNSGKILFHYCLKRTGKDIIF